MKIEDYISSGILEAYLLGEVSSEERADVEDKLRRYPSIQDEYNRIQVVQEKMARATAITPPDHIKNQLMSRFPKQAKEIRLPRTSTPWMLSTAASVTIALIAGYFAISYKQQLDSATHELATLMARNRQMAEQYNQVNQQIDELEGTLNILDNPAYTKVVMRGTESFPEGMASVYWNNDTDEVYLTVQNLKNLSREQQFQLWAIVDGKPVDAGVFNDEHRMVKMKSLEGATAFAVTVEPAGGSVTPTLSAMVVIGSV